KDIDRIITTGSSGDKDKGIGIIEGRFQPTKWKAVAAQAAQNNGDVIKLGKLGALDLWEISVPNQDQNFFVVMPDDKTILFAPKKASLEDALAQKAGTREAKLKASIKALVAKTNAKQSMSVVALTAGLVKALKEAPLGMFGQQGEQLEKIIPQ